jgi:V-type H+-transporting ATPase subunit a
MLIYMFLQPGTVDEELYSGQGVVQVILLLLAVANVPILLLLKPLWLRYQHNKTAKQGYRGIGDTSRITHALDDDDDESNPDAHANGRDSMGDDEGAMITENIGGGDEEHEEFEFSEVMIHQVSLTFAFM